MSTDITAQLSELARQADTPARSDAVSACASYCGRRATAVQARRFVAEQIELLAPFDDRYSRKIRDGWQWLADELSLAALEAPAPARRRERTGRNKRSGRGGDADAVEPEWTEDGADVDVDVEVGHPDASEPAQAPRAWLRRPALRRSRMTRMRSDAPPAT